MQDIYEEKIYIPEKINVYIHKKSFLYIFCIRYKLDIIGLIPNIFDDNRFNKIKIINRVQLFTNSSEDRIKEKLIEYNGNDEFEFKEYINAKKMFEWIDSIINVNDFSNKI